MTITSVSAGFFTLALLGACMIRGHAEDLIFQKSLPDKNTLVATRQEVPPIAMSPVVKAWAKSLPLGHSVTSASYRYLYTYELESKGAKPIILWAHSVDSFDSIPPGPTSATQYAPQSTSNVVLDVLIEGKVLIAVYKQGRDVLANVVRPDGTSGTSSIPYFDSILVSDSERMGTELTVIGAVISGSVKAGTLIVSIKTLHGTELQYHWIGGHWIRNKEELSPKKSQ